MNTEGEINEDYKMAKALNFFIFISLSKKTNRRKKKDLRVITKQQPQNGYQNRWPDAICLILFSRGKANIRRESICTEDKKERDLKNISLLLYGFECCRRSKSNSWFGVEFTALYKPLIETTLF